MGGKAGIIETTFKDEVKQICLENNRFMVSLSFIKNGFETLTEAGYPPEMVYFETLHEVKLIVDLIYEGGIANMNSLNFKHRRIREYVSEKEL